MKANKKNIQEVYSDIPYTWEHEGNVYQGYNHFTELHYKHGWRDVVVPEIDTTTHRMGDEFVLINDKVTKEVFAYTDAELLAIQKSKVPYSVKNIQLRKALIQIGIFPSTITAAIYNLPQSTNEEKVTRELMINLWEFEDDMRRESKEIISFGANFKLFEKELNELFILASTL